MITSAQVKNLRELMRMKEEIEAELAAAQDEIKAEMTRTNTYIFTGSDYKITWNEVKQSKIDTKALKEELPDVAKKYTKESVYRRFLVA